jgi:3-hydroxyisobutyrate dehydrogenase-like beta-hydroxyacid dehydrogenase
MKTGFIGLGHMGTAMAAETLRVPMPLGSLLHDRFLRLLAEGGERLDWAAIGGLAAQDAGEGLNRV